MHNPTEQRQALELCKHLHPVKWNRLTMEQRRELVNQVRPDSSEREIERAFRKVANESAFLFTN